MRLVVPYRSHKEVRTLVEGCGLRPNILLVLVPGVREDGHLEPAPEVTGEDIPHVWGGGGVPSHIVPVGPDGSIEGITLRSGDRVFVIEDTPPILVWAAACLAANLETSGVSLIDDEQVIIVMTPIAAHVEATEEYDYGGD